MDIFKNLIALSTFSATFPEDEGLPNLDGQSTAALRCFYEVVQDCEEDVAKYFGLSDAADVHHAASYAWFAMRAQAYRKGGDINGALRCEDKAETHYQMISVDNRW